MKRFYPWDEALVPGRLNRRYKRFLADVDISGDEVTAHCANPGSMLGMATPGSEVLLRHVPDPRRKLKWTWEMVRPPGQAWIGCNTGITNQVARWAIETGQAPGLSAESGLRTEVPYGKSRVDILLGDDDLHYVEVKNTTLARDSSEPTGAAFGSPAQIRENYPVAAGTGPHVATFPDSVTTRGAKHMQELQAMVQDGHRATILFIVNRGDCNEFSVARDIDPGYGAAFDAARDAGVNVLPLAMDVSPEGWLVSGTLPLRP